jgi:hypothetical protein
MKNIVYVVFFVVVNFFCANTARAQDLYKPLGTSESNSLSIIGSVQIEIPNANVSAWDGRPTKANKEQAYILLLAEAKKSYQRNDVDIRNILATSFFTKGKGWTVAATGDVVVRAGSSNATNVTGVEGALARAANDVSKDFTSNARIAIVQITAPDRSTRDYMIGEIEFILQKQGYYLVDRAQLDKIFEEQQFGATSDVDDNTAARMGKISGASIVITGKVDGEGNLRRLRLRALNTETARVVGVASERL